MLSGMSAIYLKQIIITGLFGYKNLSWDVYEDVNILGGDNGSGKSTVFQICHSLIVAGYIRDARYARLVDKVTLVFSNGYSLIWEKQRLMPTMAREAGYSYFNIGNGKVEKDGSVEIQRVKATDEQGNIKEPSSIVNNVGSSLLSSFDQTILDSQKIAGEKENNDRTYLDKLLTSYISYRNSRVSQILINSLSRGAQEGKSERGHRVTISGKDAQYIILFNEALKDFFGENYQIKAGMESQITMISKKTNEEIAYQDLSLGEKEMLLLIVFISNTYDEPVLVWLDEPDLGLHVDWQENLIACLRRLNPNIQLFVSTHAPSMVEGNQERVKEMSEITL